MPQVKEVKKEIKRQTKLERFITPFYEKYCFSNIPSTILNFFDIKTKRPSLPSKSYKDKVEIENSNKVVLFLIDGFGYNQLLRSKNCEFFNILNQKSVTLPITTVFPSTTAATLTTINTGLTPQEHGLPEWVVYFKEIDMIINTLPFKPLGERCNDRLLEMGVNPKILYNGKTIYQALKREGIKSFSFIDETYAYSSYSKLVHKGSKIIPFVNSSDLVVSLRKCLEKESEPAYFYVYIGDMDSIEHKYGPNTDECYAELSVLSYLLKKELLEKIDRKVAKEIIFLVTTDHGQLNVSPRKTIYLNKYKKLVSSFQRNKKKVILPTGSPRDVFLYIKQNKLEETYEYLSDKLKEKAKIMKIEQAIKIGLFGLGNPIKEFYERVGNLLILPYDNQSIWYEHIKGKKFDLLGIHGGLSEDEMLVYFSISKLSDLL